MSMEGEGGFEGGYGGDEAGGDYGGGGLSESELAAAIGAMLAGLSGGTGALGNTGFGAGFEGDIGSGGGAQDAGPSDEDFGTAGSGTGATASISDFIGNLLSGLGPNSAQAANLGGILGGGTNLSGIQGNTHANDQALMDFIQNNASVTNTAPATFDSRFGDLSGSNPSLGAAIAAMLSGLNPTGGSTGGNYGSVNTASLGLDTGTSPNMVGMGPNGALVGQLQNADPASINSYLESMIAANAAAQSAQGSTAGVPGMTAQGTNVQYAGSGTGPGAPGAQANLDNDFQALVGNLVGNTQVAGAPPGGSSAYSGGAPASAPNISISGFEPTGGSSSGGGQANTNVGSGTESSPQGFEPAGSTFSAGGIEGSSSAPTQGTYQMSGGSSPPPDNSLAVEQSREQAAKDTRSQDAADAAAKAAQLAALRQSSRDAATGSVNDFFTSQGLDPSAFAGQIGSKLNTIYSGIAPDDPNPGAAFTDAGNTIYSSLTDAARTKALNNFNSFFAPNFETQRLPTNYADTNLDAIRASQRQNAENIIHNMLSRGVITNTGFAADEADLDRQDPGVRARLSSIGQGVISDEQNALRSIADKGRATAQTLKLGQQFDPTSYSTQADTDFTNFVKNLNDTLNAKVGTGNLYSTAGLSGIAGAAQGAGNTAFDPNAAAGVVDQNDPNNTKRTVTPTTSVF